MQFRPHGNFEITLIDEASIILVKFTGAWNKEETHEFGEILKTTELARRWIAIADLSEWEGGTPDFPEAYLPIVDWSIANGEIATAMISRTELALRFIKKITEYRQLSIPQAMFTDEAEAVSWAREILNSQADEKM